MPGVGQDTNAAEPDVSAEKQFARTLDLFLAPAAIVQADGNAVVLNQAFTDRYHGILPPGTPGERTFFHLLGQDVSTQFLEGIRMAMSTRAPATRILPFLSESGRTDPERVHFIPLENPGGADPLVVVLLTGFSGEDAAIADLSQREAKYRTLFFDSHLVVMLIDPKTGVIVDANPGASRYYGYSVDELTGMNISVINPIPRERILSGLYSGLHRHASHFNIRHRLASGEMRFVEVHSGPVAIGGRLLLYSIVHDVTDRIRTTRALIESEEKFRELTDLLPLIVFEIDTTGRFTYANRIAFDLTGYSQAEFDGGVRIEEVISQDDLGRARTSLVRVLEGEDLVHQEYMALRKDGSLFPVAIRSSRIMRHGTATGLRCIAWDITGQKAWETAIRRSNEKLHLLTGLTRHDILNQVTALMGYLTLMHEDPEDPGIGETIEKALHVTAVIREQIEFTRDYQHLGLAAPTWQDLSMVVKKATRSVKAFEGIISSEIPHGFLVYADPMLGRVFYNLFENALRHGGTVTSVRVSCQSEDTGVSIICEDNGQGIPASMKDAVFQKGVGKNTGLGLFLAREILSISGLRISETGVPGKGCRFVIDVPEGQWRMDRGQESRGPSNG